MFWGKYRKKWYLRPFLTGDWQTWYAFLNAQSYISFGYMSYGRATKYVILSRDDRNVSFGRASKYVIWSGVENVIWSGVEIYHLVICHLVGRWNLSFGRVSTYVNWSGVELCHLVGCDTLSGFEIYHLVRRWNMSFGRASRYIIFLYFIWSNDKICHYVGLEIYHLVRRRIMSFGRASK